MDFYFFSQFCITCIVQGRWNGAFISNISFYLNEILIGHFTVMDGSEAKGDLVLIQTFFALLWKLFLKILVSIRIT